MMNSTSLKFIRFLALWLALAGHSGANQTTCTDIDISCAKTVSGTVSESGRIWLAWVVAKHLYINYSDDRGRSLSAPIKVNQQPEAIAARGENRPKIALDRADNIYLSWVKNLPQKWTADIRFSWSSDQGKSFSQAVTVNDDQRITSHSFNEMMVTDDGQVNIMWLDGRNALAAKEQNRTYTGSAIYQASFNVNKTTDTANNLNLVNGSCVCCRLAMTKDQRHLPVLMWRHIFGDNYRDHALLTMTDHNQWGTPKRVSFENWQIDGCPHHGPSLISQNKQQGQRIHMSWFNDAPLKSGLFYAYTDDEGQNISRVQDFARNNNPSHPQLALTAGGKLQLVWQEFNGLKQQVKLIRSDNGEQWTSAELIAEHNAPTDYPSLLTHASGNLLLWHRPGQPLQLIEVN